MPPHAHTPPYTHVSIDAYTTHSHNNKMCPEIPVCCLHDPHTHSNAFQPARVWSLPDAAFPDHKYIVMRQFAFVSGLGEITEGPGPPVRRPNGSPAALNADKWSETARRGGACQLACSKWCWAGREELGGSPLTEEGEHGQTWVPTSGIS